MTTFEQISADVHALERFTKQWTVLLTTYRQDGIPVGTPVNIAVDGPTAYIRTWEPSGKVGRLRRNPHVEIAPSTFRGRPTGEPLPATARILEGEQAEIAAHALERKYPIVQGRIVPWAHRRKGLTTIHLEVTPY